MPFVDVQAKRFRSPDYPPLNRHIVGVWVAWSDRANSPSSDPTRLARTGVAPTGQRAGINVSRCPNPSRRIDCPVRRSADPPHPPEGRTRYPARPSGVSRGPADGKARCQRRVRLLTDDDLTRDVENDWALHSQTSTTARVGISATRSSCVRINGVRVSSQPLLA